MPALAPEWQLSWEDADSRTSHLSDLIGMVGIAPKVEWLHITRADQQRPFEQVSGHARYGLIVEISTDDWAALVVPAGSPDHPLRDCGVGAWTYLAHPAELLTVPIATALTYIYVTAGIYPDTFELRDPTHRTRGWTTSKENRR
jgi:hypothetical protein